MSWTEIDYETIRVKGSKIIGYKDGDKVSVWTDEVIAKKLTFGKLDKEGIFNIKVDWIDEKDGWRIHFHLEDGRKGFYYPGESHEFKVGYCYIVKGSISYPKVYERKGVDWPRTRISHITILKELGVR